MVDVNHVGVNVAKELRKRLGIVGGQTTRPDLDINTGVSSAMQRLYV